MVGLLVSYRVPDGRLAGAVVGSSRWARLARAIADKRRTRRAARELHRMNDKLLHDIGLDRCAIEYAVRFGRE
jgi:uncharacterized protein YjiS (DUF1127 family)